MVAYRERISLPFKTRKTSYFIGMLLALFLPVSVWAEAETLSKKASRDLPNFHCVNPSYYRGGQPSSSGIEKLAQMGIKTIIDLRQPGERSESEEKLATKLGMHYVNIPVNNWRVPSQEHVTQFLKLVRDPASGPVFVHCLRGADRTGVMSGLYRMVNDGWSADQAFKEMRQLGARPWFYWLKTTLYSYAEQHTTEKSTASASTSPNSEGATSTSSLKQ